MKPSPSKSMKTAVGKKRSREEAAGSAGGSTPPESPPRPNPNKKWKKSKAKTEDLLALLNSGFLREKEVDMWRAAVGDLYLMEKNPDEIPIVTYQKFDCFPMCEFSQKFKTFCLILFATKFDPNLLDSHLKLLIK
jgi:hypothetical protein